MPQLSLECSTKRYQGRSAHWGALNLVITVRRRQHALESKHGRREGKENWKKKCMAGSAHLTLTRFEYVDASRFGCYLGQCGFDELVDFAKVGVAHPVAGATADGAIWGKGVDPNLQAGLAWVICSILFQRHRIHHARDGAAGQ